ncbi:fatty acid-binding protein, liver-like [Acanthaster planci]|uniref:Fatty acid-binding protein, liver-like n=1 Tax=Acanthaster planci TaxID=133434 RepID=A0A8B7ZVQ7_ACAPL|nr:fatty acid-binding protein, liver-like [Acanthaster planci]
MAQFNGKYKLDPDNSQNLEEFMKALGVSEEMRKIGSSVVPEVTIETADGKHFKMTTVTTYTTVVVEFNLGEEQEITTADGRKTKNVYTLDGTTLKHVETPADGNGPTATYNRTLNAAGDIEMVMTTGSVVAKRLYKKL